MAKQASRKGKTAKKTKPLKPARISYHRRPDDLTLDLWQLGLRKQFGEENTFQITSLGKHPVFSEFLVWNPETRNQYHVSIRTAIPQKGLPLHNTLTQIGNACTCQDFKTNRLGLSKHISAVLHKQEKVYGAKKSPESLAPPGKLIQTGISFFSGLVQTLSSPEKTQELIQSIVATDEATGQTCLKMPVENAAVVENAVRLLSGLLAGLGR
jgi:hypothetical protein